MRLEQTYYLHSILDDLVKKYNFSILYINEIREEYWLEKKIEGITHVVRIIEAGFDWKNQLKADMQEAIWRAKKLENLVLGRKIELHNLYIANFAPVDEWNELKKPLMIKNSKYKTMYLYYLEDDEKDKEMARFYHSLGLPLPEIYYPESEFEMESSVKSVKADVRQMFNQYKREMKEVFNNGKPIVSYLLIGLNIVIFLLLEWAGGSTSTMTLIKFGAKYNPFILEGEWWRIISSMFLHIGTLHLLMNMLALHFVGAAVERIYGTSRFTLIYFLSGIIGGLASFTFSPQIAAGASGAIFGLFGALLYFGINYRRIFFQTMGWNVIIVIIVNIVFGLSIPQIDNGAHLGGLLGGFIAATIVNVPKKRTPVIQILSLFCYLGLISLLTLQGIQSAQISSEIQLKVAQELINEKEYNQVIDITSIAISNDEEATYQAELLFFRSYAYIKIGQNEKAREDLIAVIEKKDDFPEAHYNLSLLYEDSEQLEKAVLHAQLAKKLAPGNKQFQNHYERLLEEE